MKPTPTSPVPVPQAGGGIPPGAPPGRWIVLVPDGSPALERALRALEAGGLKVSTGLPSTIDLAPADGGPGDASASDRTALRVWVVPAAEIGTGLGSRNAIDAVPPEAGAGASLRWLEWSHIQRVLADCGGNISAAARRLGMHRRSLQRKLAKHPPPR